MQISHPSEDESAQQISPVTEIYAGRMFDSESLSLMPSRVITVSADSGLILAVDPYDPVDVEAAASIMFADSNTIDLRAQTVLPGFVDAHVHFFLHPYSETPWEDQLTKESLVERTVRATVHAKRTLLAGFTSVRDLGTEGAADADISLRQCLSGPDALVPGPRYFCANRAIAPTGSYGPKSSIYLNHEGIDGITGAEAADGVDECVKAVRRQIGAGADWIKIYADYRFRSRLTASTRAAKASIRTFNTEETKAIIDTAHQYGVKVAAHAINEETAKEVTALGVDTIEHGYAIATIRCFWRIEHLRPQTIWLPTLAAYHATGQEPGGPWSQAVQTFQHALEAEFDAIACGGDTGVFPHGENAREMQLMVQLGADWKRVLGWATLGGWKCIRSMAWEGADGAQRLGRVSQLKEDQRVVGDNEVPFGVLKKGFAADIIATTGDFDADFAAAVRKESISFVMKGGQVYKRDGLEVTR